MQCPEFGAQHPKILKIKSVQNLLDEEKRIIFVEMTKFSKSLFLSYRLPDRVRR